MLKAFFPLLFVLMASTILAQNTCKPKLIDLRADKYQLEYDAKGKLVQFTDRYENRYKLVYDKNGKLVKMENFESDGELYDYYVYSGDKMEVFDEDGLTITYRYELKDGKPIQVWEDYGDEDVQLIAELTWKDGNVIQQTVYDGRTPTVYRFEFDQSPNPLQVLSPLVHYQDLLLLAEYFSANNIIKVSYDDKVLDLPIEYNASGCPVKIPLNMFGVQKLFTY